MLFGFLRTRVSFLFTLHMRLYLRLRCAFRRFMYYNTTSYCLVLASPQSHLTEKPMTHNALHCIVLPPTFIVHFVYRRGHRKARLCIVHTTKPGSFREKRPGGAEVERTIYYRTMTCDTPRISPIFRPEGWIKLSVRSRRKKWRRYPWTFPKSVRQS